VFVGLLSFVVDFVAARKLVDMIVSSTRFAPVLLKWILLRRSRAICFARANNDNGGGRDEGPGKSTICTHTFRRDK
jgi:hypothetical protein